ncbi:hypothetical protein P22_1070 [Propionispora sp. 2/2-37]|uniref:galactitol-1-phosphate 5-dehydrogenase n=1 Tax=Propionispora sp. 2/2-37 TaxID=1677858 RepID=UPI0006C088B6|nr:galactitol-1-phosphate 5-dehydrogenase [Propionispora sp. 2/2-37]CUH95001.1 hypothetical protein P22_1070 [Propionispora sp. 2/2-37]
MRKMKALIAYGSQDLRLETMDIPAYEDDEVLIRVKACGICGSDLPRALQGTAHSYPIILGHEFSGYVAAVGSSVTNIQAGQRVTAAPLLPCGSCQYCKIGRPAMCESYNFVGSRRPGAFAEYVAIKAINVVPLADEVDYPAGAMIEPISVALHGVGRVSFNAGATAAVFGAGTIGLLTLQCLKAQGAGKVYVVDVIGTKLRLAQQLGADAVINALEDDPVDYMKQQGQPAVVFETAGSPLTQRQSIEVVSKLGKVVFVGTATKELGLPPHSFEKILRGEIEVTGSWMSYSAPYPGYEWPAVALYIKEGKIKTDPLITHKFKLEDGINAFRTMVDKDADAIKVMFVM